MTKKSLKIADKIVGENRPVFIIAEAGVNHNGRLDLALKLIDAAKTAGADAVKFQTFKTEQVVTKEVKMAEYQKKNTGKEETQFSMLKKLELEESFYPKLLSYAKNKKIILLSTPHGGFESVDLLREIGIPAFKFGSGDLTNLPVLQYAAGFKKPMILGTGMANMVEVKEAVDCIKKTGNNKIIVLHCTTNYPCPDEEVNLRAMQTMMKELNVLVGYSDHTLGFQTPLMAAALGACVIEKHFTLDRSLPGPDHKSSLEPEELNDMIRMVKKSQIILGSAVKEPTVSEKKIKSIVRKSIVALDDIGRGDKLTMANIGIKRPGTGIAPKYISTLIGRKAKEYIKKDYLIKLKNLL